MEDLAPILWIVVIIGAMVFSSVSKVRKLAEKATKHLEDRIPGQEAWPSWDTSSAPEPSTAAETTATTSPHHATEPEIQPAIETSRLETTAFRQFAEQPDIPATTPAEPRISSIESKSPANSGQGNITEDFDLRRAIIYSEILKPKFDE